MVKAKSLLARRRLMATLVVLSLLAAVSFLSNSEPVAQVGTTTEVVGIARTVDAEGNVDYSPDEAQIDAAVREAVALAGGLPENIGPGKKIVIQPNMVDAGWVFTNPNDAGVCTHRQVVRTLVNMCVELGANINDIVICEGSGGFRDGNQGGYGARQMTRKSYRDCGYDLVNNVNGYPVPDMIDDATGARLIDANYAGEYNGGGVYPDFPQYSGPYDSKYVTEIVRSDYWVSRKYFVPNCVAECDVLIRVPVLKTHDLAGYTGALKLAFGHAPSDIYHYPGLQFYKWGLLHKNVSYRADQELAINAQGMVDMTLARPPDFIVIDGLVGIITGPNRVPAGEPGPRKANPYMACILASRNPVAIDTIGTLAICYKHNSIPGLQRAQDKGLGPNDPRFIEVRGASVHSIRRWFDRWATDPVTGNLSTTVAIPGDRTPPNLGNILIQPDSQVPGQLIVSPAAYSDPELCKGELYVDGVLVDSNHNTGYSTKTGILSTGSHTIKYVLYDFMLNEKSITRTVNVTGVDPIRAALNTPDGGSISLGPDMVFAGKAAAIDNRTFFVSSKDGIRGLRVRFSGSAPNMAIGQAVALSGTMSTEGGQRYLNCTSYSPGPSGFAVKPRFMKNCDLGGAGLNEVTDGVTGGVGPYNLGCLVKVSGKVSAGGSDYFWISDGSLGSAKLKVKCGNMGQPAPGTYVSIVGFSCCEKDGSAIRRVLVARSAGEIYSH